MGKRASLHGPDKSTGPRKVNKVLMKCSENCIHIFLVCSRLFLINHSLKSQTICRLVDLSSIESDKLLICRLYTACLRHPHTAPNMCQRNCSERYISRGSKSRNLIDCKFIVCHLFPPRLACFIISFVCYQPGSSEKLGSTIHSLMFVSNSKFSASVTPISYSPNYLLRCTVADKRGKTNIVFELEVCHLPRMDLIGLLIHILQTLLFSE